VILTRALADSTLRTWGLKLREKIGFKRAAVAVARKLARDAENRRDLRAGRRRRGLTHPPAQMRQP